MEPTTDNNTVKTRKPSSLISKITANIMHDIDTNVPVGTPYDKKLSYSELLSKPENDIDLVDVIKDILLEKSNQHAVDVFLSHPIVMQAHDVHSLTQRVLLNRYFIQTITRARAYIELEGPTFILGSISNIGTHQSWLRTVEHVIIPYFITSKIFNLFKIEK